MSWVVVLARSFPRGVAAKRAVRPSAYVDPLLSHSHAASNRGSSPSPTRAGAVDTRVATIPSSPNSQTDRVTGSRA
jgi:hypothetical protein